MLSDKFLRVYFLRLGTDPRKQRKLNPSIIFRQLPNKINFGVFIHTLHFLQLSECHDDRAIRDVFKKNNYLEALFSTGRSKPVSSISIRDKTEIRDALKTHYMIKAVIPEINEFRDGLQVLGVFDYVQKYPDIMRVCFADEQPPLTAGMF